MRKGIARRCLCIALASAMVFGDVGIASAAESNSADTKEVVSVTADEGIAEVAASAPTLDTFYAEKYSYNSSISVGASANAYKMVLLVNGKRVRQSTAWDDNSYNSIYENIPARPGTTYTIELRYSNKDGKVYKKQKKLTTDVVAFNKDRYDMDSEIEAESISEKTDATGINKPTGITVRWAIDTPGYYEYKWELYRSTKPSGGYKRIATGTSSSSWGGNYTDTKVTFGRAYYYKVRLLRGTDEYVTKDKVLAVSSAAGVRYGVPECTLSRYSYGNDNGKKAAVALSMSSLFANQYDLYRSTNKAKGYKKIATVYANYYEDTRVKKGTVYYYKAVPKYYDSKTGRTVTGKATDPTAVRYLMDPAYFTLTQVSKTSMKCEWETENSADVSYEIWYRRSDLYGDAYRKAAVTKKKYCVLRNLAADGTYDVVVRTVKKAGSVAKYEWRDLATLTMGYTASVRNLGITPVKSVADKKKGVVAVYYRLTWNKDWGASGYYVTAYNNYTGKTETIKKLSAKATSYTFRNVGNKTKGVKYSSIQIVPFRGKAMGDANGGDYWSTRTLPETSMVKASRKSGTAVQITWRAVPGAAKYKVRRTTALGVQQTIGTTTSTKFVDTHVTNGMDYTYSVYVVAADAGFSTNYGGWLYVYSHALSRPSITSGVNSSSRTATIKWGKIANAKCYKVYRSDKANGKYVQVARTSSKVMVYADKKLKKGKTYYYRVVAYTVNGCGKTVKSTASGAKAVKIRK